MAESLQKMAETVEYEISVDGISKLNASQRGNADNATGPCKPTSSSESSSCFQKLRTGI